MRTAEQDSEPRGAEPAGVEPEQTANRPRGRVDLASLAFCLLGNLLLRAAAAAAGTLIFFYLASLQQAGSPVRAQVVGLAAVLFYSAELVGSPSFGLLCDLRSRKPFMLLGPLFGGLAVQLIVLAPTIPLILLARAFQGLSTASSVPATLSYLASETGHSERLRGRTMGLFEVVSLVGIAGGFATGGVLWDLLGHSAFVPVVGLYATSAVLLWLVRDRSARASRKRKAPSHFAFLRSASALRLIPAWMAVNAVVGVWFSQLAFQMGKADDPAQVLVGGFSGRQIGLYTAGAALLFVVGITLWTLAFGRLRMTRIMGIALGGVFGLVGALYLLNHYHAAGRLESLGLVGLVGGMLLVASGFTPAALAYLAGLAEGFPEARGSLMGLYSVFLGVGQILGSLAGSYSADWLGVDGMIALTAILGVISVVCFTALARQEHRGGPISLPGRFPLSPDLC